MSIGKVHYKRSLKKQYVFFVIWSVSVILILYVSMAMTSQWLLYFVIAISALTAMLIVHVRKAAREAVCPSCQIDLYEVIDAAKMKKIDFRHCPACGVSIAL